MERHHHQSTVGVLWAETPGNQQKLFCAGKFFLAMIAWSFIQRQKMAYVLGNQRPTVIAEVERKAWKVIFDIARGKGNVAEIVARFFVYVRAQKSTWATIDKADRHWFKLGMLCVGILCPVCSTCMRRLRETRRTPAASGVSLF